MKRIKYSLIACLIIALTGCDFSGKTSSSDTTGHLVGTITKTMYYIENGTPKIIYALNTGYNIHYDENTIFWMRRDSCSGYDQISSAPNKLGTAEVTYSMNRQDYSGYPPKIIAASIKWLCNEVPKYKVIKVATPTPTP